jgi:DNA-binding Lrp family transcriptional regulator
MVFGYILISTKNSYEHVVINKLSNVDEVVDVEPLLVEETAMADSFFEDYDLIAKIKAVDISNMKKIVDEKIHTIFGIEKIKVVTKPKL